MALRLSGRLNNTQVMPASFSTRMASYFELIVLLRWANAAIARRGAPSPRASRLLLPAVHRQAVQRVRRQLQDFHPHAVRVDDVGQNGLRAAARPDFLNLGAARFPHLGRRLDVFDVNAEMIDAGRAISGDRLDFDEGVLADLDID